MSMVLYTGDLEPDLVVTCTSDGTPVNLTSAESIRVIGKIGGTVVVDAAATGDANGVVTYSWQAGDTDVPGRMTVEVEVTWPAGRPQTFRASNHVDILPDLA